MLATSCLLLGLLLVVILGVTSSLHATSSKVNLSKFRKISSRLYHQEHVTPYGGYIEDEHGPMFIGLHKIGESKKDDDYRKYLISEFDYLITLSTSMTDSGRGKFLKFLDFEKWAPLVTSKSIEVRSLTDAWIATVGSLEKTCDLPSFVKLCSLLPLGMKDSSMTHMVAEFSNLVDFASKAAMKAKVLPFLEFMKWGEIEEILIEKFLTRKQIEDLWVKVVGSLTLPCDIQDFLEINEMMDEMAE